MKWPKVSLDEIKAPVRYSFVGGPFGSNLTTRDYVDEGVPVIRGNNLPADSTFLDDDFVFVREQKAETLTSNLAHGGDLIFTQRGTLGQVGLIPREPRFPSYVISQSQMKLTVDPDRADAKFIYFYFRSPATVQSVINHAITSGVPHINLGILKRFEVPLPPLDVQQRISEVLTTYDALVANNRRRMALLEAAARQLYAEWFVRLRYPGHKRTPIVDGLPKGWERKPLGEVMTLKRGHDLPSQDRMDGDIPVVSSSGITGFHNAKKADAPGVVTGRYGTIGEVYYIDRDYWPLNTALYVTDFKGNPPHFVLYLLKEALQGIQSEKAAIPGLNRNVLHTISVLCPPKALRDRFNEFAKTNYRQIDLLTAMNEKLRTARDLLLPRMMSGHIEV